jgi:hypothetical protein
MALWTVTRRGEVTLTYEVEASSKEEALALADESAIAVHSWTQSSSDVRVFEGRPLVLDVTEGGHGWFDERDVPPSPTEDICAELRALFPYPVPTDGSIDDEDSGDWDEEDGDETGEEQDDDEAEEFEETDSEVLLGDEFWHGEIDDQYDDDDLSLPLDDDDDYSHLDRDDDE